MDMLVNDTNIIQFNAKLTNITIEPATVNNVDEWLRDSLTPLHIYQQFENKKITTEILVSGINREDLLINISKITSILAKCTIQADNMCLYYDVELQEISTTKTPSITKKLLTCTFNGICYAQGQQVNLNSGSIGINNIGTMPCPAVVVMTAPVDTPIVTLSGLSDDNIQIKYLKKGVPVTIDGENKTITEIDLDHFVTEDTGQGKWIYKYWNIAMANSPELTARPDVLPTKDFINKNISCYHQELIQDAQDLVYNEVTNIFGSIKTGLYVNSAKSITFQFKHDDGVNVYLNNNSVYSSANAEIDTPSNPNYPTLTLALNQGWNVLEFIYINHLSEGGVYALTQKLSDMVDGLNCYYARDLSYLEVANKFQDVELWEFPKLQMGNNTISIDNNIQTNISYKPRYL
ncbi:hypothetical protein [Clostridium felsineum]|uniref:Uncharacterized protein n=1 Tax=Clostridium felsineum TaxID=36839 RepID=A0A1S8M2J4_9CLOT|nr:hypothetical protein [Clostridium felsineum]URZ06765.1 hypothetical protein CLROS_020980 [Clostridium felsineum]URZ11797.1 hypothetical protein CROST_025140 [Clostridium felsineum]